MSEEGVLMIVADRLKEIHTDILELRQENSTSMDRLSKAVEALVRLEERQNVTNQELVSVKEDVKEQERRLDEIESTMPELERLKWMVWGTISFVATYVATFIFNNFSSLLKYFSGA